MLFRSRLMVASLSVLAGACSLAPKYHPPVVTMPAAYDQAARVPYGVGPDWWQSFGNAELNKLITEALAANQDIEGARQRIKQSRAALRVADSSLLPSLDAGGSATRSRSKTSGSDATVQTSRKGSFSAAYELDLFGANQAGSDAANARLASSVYAGDAISLVVQSDVVSDYVQILTLKDRIRIAHENLDAARKILDVVRVRVTEGYASPLDLAKQEGNVATIEAGIPFLEQQLSSSLTSLAILLGRAPQGFSIENSTLSSLTLPEPAAGQPSDLLERRPDIREAEADLIAANADIGAARAAFFPSITLSASDAITSIVSGGTTTAMSMAAGLTAPIFSGGRIEGNLEKAKARYAELVSSYRQTVFTGMKEAQDALVGIDATSRKLDLLAISSNKAAEASRIANEQYTAGASDFMSLLDAQRSLLSAQDSYVQADSARYLAALALYKALGGGWADHKHKA